MRQIVRIACFNLLLLALVAGGCNEWTLRGAAEAQYPHITQRPQPTVGLGCRSTSVAGLISLPELGPGTYLGSQGGLYPNGANEPPPEWVQAGLSAAREILPRDANGRPTEDGKIVLLSIGMSNATHEWSGHSPHFEGAADGFMPQAARYADRNPHLVIVDGAVSGRAANAIVPGGVYYATYWPMVMMRLSQAGVTANQVQIIWLKEANPCPGQPICGNRNLTPARGDWPGYAQELRHDLEQIVKELEVRFPNLKQVFVSPRIYGGYALSTLNPEPFAFETGFAVKWLIEERINAGQTKPWLDWGPYLWANGLTPNAQGLAWACEDFVESDRTHPSKSGVAKVGKALLDFFTTSPFTRSWFTVAGKPATNGGEGPVFGAHISFGQQSPPPDANLMRDLGIRTTTYWAYPVFGSAFNVSQVVQAIDEIKRQTGGLDVRVHLMPLSQAEARRLGNMFRLPANMSAYLASIRQLAQALKGKVQYYSIGNEFSGISWLGTVEEYGQLLEQTRQAIKSVDPSAVILDSGMAGLTLAMTIPNDLYQQGKTPEAIDFLNKLIAHHVGGFRQYLPITSEAQLVAFLNLPEVAKTIQMSDARFSGYCGFYDVLQLHDYQGWETLEEVFEWVQTKMSAASCIKPIEVWELGYGWDDAATYNVEVHAKAVAKLLVIATAKGAQTIIYFPLTDRGNFARALLTRNYGVLPPAIAYKVAAEKLSGVTQAQKLDLGEGVWAYGFTKESQEIYALWSDAPRLVSLPTAASAVRITTINGDTIAGDPKSIVVGESPIFIESAIGLTLTHSEDNQQLFDNIAQPDDRLLFFRAHVLTGKGWPPRLIRGKVLTTWPSWTEARQYEDRWAPHAHVFGYDIEADSPPDETRDASKTIRELRAYLDDVSRRYGRPIKLSTGLNYSFGTRHAVALARSDEVHLHANELLRAYPREYPDGLTYVEWVVARAAEVKVVNPNVNIVVAILVPEMEAGRAIEVAQALLSAMAAGRLRFEGFTLWGDADATKIILSWLRGVPLRL